MVTEPPFWKERRVLVTGHTGFKGVWLTLWLDALGANVTGLALRPPLPRSAFADMHLNVPQVEGDVRDVSTVTAAIELAQPEVVFHLASQSLVRPSYRQPLETMTTNIIGTVNLLLSLANSPARAVVVVTSDKVYDPTSPIGRDYVETDVLGGVDPYSASKACQDIVARALHASLLRSGPVSLATARSGNVIGGGDWAEDRLIPDAARSWEQGSPLIVRNPGAIRPWQHVLDPLRGYMMLAERLYRGEPTPTALNFGPEVQGVTVTDVLGLLAGSLRGLTWKVDLGDHPAETAHLMIDSQRARKVLGWKPRLDLVQAVEWTAAWYEARTQTANLRSLSLGQIAAYEQLT